MNVSALLNKIGRYGAIGMLAAAVHAAVLLLLGRWIPWSLANPIAFLAASFAGYFGHALVTFREETGGRRFARRWLLLQYSVNLTVCALLPLVKAPMLVMVFTPTVLNALIWNKAANFCRDQQNSGGLPALHADDLGLAPGVDQAILTLMSTGRLDGASLLVDGPSAETAVATWKDLESRPPLTLHLCLSEGLQPEHCPDLPASFGQLLLASFWPAHGRRLRPQLERAIRHQIRRYRHLSSEPPHRVDGHQHIHLVPLVLDVVLQQPDIHWVRTTAEPLPSHLPLKLWLFTLRGGGMLKWLILRLLTAMARPRLKAAGIATNPRFAGVLFTGRMAGKPLDAAINELKDGDLVLAHPAAPNESVPNEEESLLKQGFELSSAFLQSPWRHHEWNALRNRAPRARSNGDDV